MFAFNCQLISALFLNPIADLTVTVAGGITSVRKITEGPRCSDEVSDSTLEEDTHEKARLYASGGIEDYWVIDLVRGSSVGVPLGPKPDPNSKPGKDYASVCPHKRDDKLTPIAAPKLVLVNDLSSPKLVLVNDLLP